MSIPLATVATLFLERPGLARSTVQSYELSLMPLLGEYGSYPIEILSRRALADYLDSLPYLAYTTHQRHQGVNKREGAVRGKITQNLYCIKIPEIEN